VLWPNRTAGRETKRSTRAADPRQHGCDLGGIVEQHPAASGQVIQQAGGLAVEIGHVPFQVAEAGAVQQLLDLALVFDARRRVTGREVELVQALGHALAQPGQRFGSRPNPGLLQPVKGALGGRVKGAQAVNLIAEQLDTDRLAQVGRPDVDDASTAAELTRQLDHGRALIAQANPIGQHLVEIEDLALADRAQCGPHLAHR
jgi:hypothetical protein